MRHSIATSSPNYGGAGALLSEYIWVDGRPVATVADAGTASPKLYFTLTDHLERPIMMVDDSRAIVWRATYLPYGEVSTISGPAVLDYRFPGQWFQLETGLHYNWHRTYDPSIGRYLQPDRSACRTGQADMRMSEIVR